MSIRLQEEKTIFHVVERKNSPFQMYHFPLFLIAEENILFKS